MLLNRRSTTPVYRQFVKPTAPGAKELLKLHALHPGFGRVKSPPCPRPCLGGRGFSEKQRRFLEEKFTIGETTGRKSDPVSVAQQMRAARGSDGQPQLTPKELLTANQIQGFFSRRAKSKNQAVVEAEDDFAAAVVEDAMANVRNEAINQTQSIHPVTFDGYNLWDLVSRGRLCKLTVPVLRDICCYFELEINAKSLQMPRRKAPYVEILEKHFNFAAYLVKKYCFARAFNPE